MAVEHLRERGVTPILLKGPAIATWLYDDGMPRPYRDIDLLVAPAEFEKATAVLAELGYTPRLLGAHPSELGAKELDLVGPDNQCLDLHHGLLGASRSSQECWNVLMHHTVTLRLAGRTEVAALDIPARAMHLALHAAQNGPIDSKAVADLERGLVRVGRPTWQEAAALAEQIGASEAFAAGLRLVPAGQVLADELSLTRRMTVELALRSASAPRDSLFFERLSQAHGLRRKAALVARKFVPTDATLRANSALARRGRLGLLLARAVRSLSLAIRLGPAFLAWYRARRAVSARE